MNIDAASAQPGAIPPPAPPDWTMDVEPQDAGGHVGVVKRSDVVMCRILVAGSSRDARTIRRRLADKARAWIAGYLSRPHTGDSGFQTLDDGAEESGSSAARLAIGRLASQIRRKRRGLWASIAAVKLPGAAVSAAVAFVRPWLLQRKRAVCHEAPYLLHA